MSTLAEVRLWGSPIGAVFLQDGRETAVFEYDPTFARSGIEVSPLRMPLGPERYTFPALNPETFHGLPGLLSDSLPDRFGNALIDAWLAAQGRGPESFNAVERLRYVGTRGMGALEFAPARGPSASPGEEIHLAKLVELASEVLTRRERLVASLIDGEDSDAMAQILSVGTSAGGARAKAVVAWNPQTGEMRSGQLELPDGYEHWLLKFDGVENNRDKDLLSDPRGYGAIEYAYSNMAKDAAIQMSPCRLLREGARKHFMTKRFDRDEQGGKRHMQSLCGLAHFDFNQAGAYSYEQAFLAMRNLGLAHQDTEQLFRRMVFNVIARNQDDHVKNIAFLMDRAGTWELAPAFDMTYAYRPGSRWTARHQMSINGKREDFTMQDLRDAGQRALLKRGGAEGIFAQVRDVVARWPEYAAEAGVRERHIESVQHALRLQLPAA